MDVLSWLVRYHRLGLPGRGYDYRYETRPTPEQLVKDTVDFLFFGLYALWDGMSIRWEPDPADLNRWLRGEVDEFGNQAGQSPGLGY